MVRRHSHLLLALIAATCAVGAAIGGGPASSRAQTGSVLIRDVRTGFDLLGSQSQPSTPADYIQPDTQVEPSIAVNPRNPLNAVAVYQEGRVAGGGDATNGFATTFDGGRSWRFGEAPGLTAYPGQTGPFDRASDAVVAFGPSNDVYLSSLVFDDTSSQALRSGMAINVSKDGGLTWSQPVFFADDLLAGVNDKNWVVVDNSDASGHHKGRVYVVWDRVAAVFYDYCDSGCDQLANWALGGTFRQLDLPPAYVSQSIGATPVVLNDGSLAVLFEGAAGGVPTGAASEQTLTKLARVRLISVVAPLAGTEPFPAPLVFGPPVLIADYLNTAVRSQRAGTLPSADYDPKTGTLWIAWEDARFHTEASPVNDILVASSADGGITWSAPQKINQSTPTDHVDRYNPSIAASPDGTIHIAYRQRLEADDPAKFSPAIDTYYQESTNGGTSWSAPLKVNAVADDARYGAFSRAGTFQGDYNGIASGGPYSYVVRAESYPMTPGEPPALAFTPTSSAPDQWTLTDAGKPHLHQQVWVAVVGPGQQSPSATPAPETSAGRPGEAPAGRTTPNTSVAATSGGAALSLGALLLVVAAASGRRRRRS